MSFISADERESTVSPAAEFRLIITERQAPEERVPETQSVLSFQDGQHTLVRSGSGAPHRTLHPGCLGEHGLERRRDGPLRCRLRRQYHVAEFHFLGDDTPF